MPFSYDSTGRQNFYFEISEISKEVKVCAKKEGADFPAVRFFKLILSADIIKPTGLISIFLFYHSQNQQYISLVFEIFSHFTNKTKKES